MASETSIPRTRRSVLTAALGGAAVVAATQLARPLAVAAADPNDLVLDQDNPTTVETSVSQGTADTTAFRAIATGFGEGLLGQSDDGPGVLGTTVGTAFAGVAGLAGDTTDSSYDDVTVSLDAGVYGFSNASGVSAGVWGEAGTTGLDGVFGSGPYGVEGVGTVGGQFSGESVGLIGMSDAFTGLIAHAGTGALPTPLAGTAIIASVSSATQVGIEAHGRVRFPNRSGRAKIGAGKASVTVTVPGMTSGNYAIATLSTNRSGRWVRSVVCAAGKITIYLNLSVSSASYISWLVLG